MKARGIVGVRSFGRLWRDGLGVASAVRLLGDREVGR